MRHFTISRFLIAFLMMLCCGTAMASDFVTVDGFKFLVDTDKDEATLLANDYSGEVVVPQKVALDGVDYPVVAFADQCFYNSNVSIVKIPNTVATLGEKCFSQSRIKSVEIPSSVVSLGKECFDQCDSLVDVALPNSILSIPESCFSICGNLKSIKIPSSVKDLGNSVFSYCRELKEIELPEGLESIGTRTFGNCESLESIELPSTLLYLAGRDFSECRSLKTIICKAENPPMQGYGSIPIFDEFDNSSCTVYVPSKSLSLYKENKEWGKIGLIKAIEGEDEEAKPCVTPAITYTSGNLSFESSTPGAEYHYTIKDTDIAIDKYNTDGKVLLNGKLDISVYATADGYKASDKATATLYWLNAEGGDATNNINLVKTRGVMVTTDSDITISGLNDGEVVTFYSVNGVNLGSAKAVQGVLHFAKPNESIVIAKIKGNDLKIAIK